MYLGLGMGSSVAARRKRNHPRVNLENVGPETGYGIQNIIIIKTKKEKKSN
jgi:hypothetical protein